MKTGTSGTVIDVQVFTRDGVEKTRAKEIENMQLAEVRGDLNEEMRIVKGATYERLIRAFGWPSGERGSWLKKRRQAHCGLPKRLRCRQMVQDRSSDEAFGRNVGAG